MLQAVGHPCGLASQGLPCASTGWPKRLQRIAPWGVSPSLTLALEHQAACGPIVWHQREACIGVGLPGASGHLFVPTCGRATLPYAFCLDSQGELSRRSQCRKPACQINATVMSEATMTNGCQGSKPIDFALQNDENQSGKMSAPGSCHPKGGLAELPAASLSRCSLPSGVIPHLADAENVTVTCAKKKLG